LGHYYRHAHKKTDRHTDTRTDRQRGSQTGVSSMLLLQTGTIEEKMLQRQAHKNRQRDRCVVVVVITTDRYNRGEDVTEASSQEQTDRQTDRCVVVVVITTDRYNR